jgi:hypothetical protein
MKNTVRRWFPMSVPAEPIGSPPRPSAGRFANSFTADSGPRKGRLAVCRAVFKTSGAAGMATIFQLTEVANCLVGAARSGPRELVAAQADTGGTSKRLAALMQGIDAWLPESEEWVMNSRTEWRNRRSDERSN